ncbi:MAG: Hpt domain-containing protein [Gemmatimonadota bacterium]|nr:Hpt domain-containing protein [Gemmatimonadota bacterium]MDE2831637.1 Hpt domain-containing protein [Gemmatimonadota bacterium]
MDHLPTSCDALIIDRNPIHRHLLYALLEQMGYRVVAVPEPPEKALSYRFAMIDIDECKNFEQQIARTQSGIPIIGLVSHEKHDQPCLRAGAAATLIRPVLADQLFAALQNLNIQPKNVQTPPIDIDRIMTRVGGRRQILKKMVDIFTEELPDQIAALHRAIDQQSSEDLRQAAHALKGAIANFDAKTAYEAAFALEQMGKSNNLSQASATCQKLEHELSAVQNALKELTLSF